MKLYLLDVSGFLFRAYFALPPMTNASGEATHALYGFVRSILKLLKQESPEHIVAVYDGPDNKKSRKAIFEGYKANRVTLHEDLPEQIQKSKIFCKLLGIPLLELEGVEADDTLGSLARWGEKNGYDVFICTADKDLCQLVGPHIKLLNPWKDYTLIDETQVLEKFGVLPKQIPDYLGLVGDSSDNIPGISGFGPKTSAPLLKQYGDIENLLAHAHEIKGQKKQETLKTEADLAILSKKLATIDCDISLNIPSDQFIRKGTQETDLTDFYLKQNFHSLVKHTPSPSTAPSAADYVLVDDLISLESLIAKLKSIPETALDVETDQLNPIDAKPIGIGFCFEFQKAYYVPLNGHLKQTALEKLKPVIEAIKFYGHNIKYDCQVLENIGIRAQHVVFDTILASYLLNPSLRSHSLDNLVLDRFAKTKIDIKSLIGTGKQQLSMAQVAIEKVCEYCCEDVDYTFRLKQLFYKELQEKNLLNLLLDLELPIATILRRMERAGVYLDIPLLQQIGEHVQKEIKISQDKIFDLADEVFNINSPKQLGQILFEKLRIPPLKKTTTGFSTDVEVLEELALTYPIAKEILSYRSLEKLRSTYIETLPTQVNPGTHRIHPTFNQFTTATGRLACHDPNLQNIPVRSELGRSIRKAFKPQLANWSYLSADYSQIELRLLAHLSEDEALIEAFKQAQDVHAYTAALMFQTNAVTPEQRYQAKAINFGIIYGQQAYGLSRELNIPVSQAASFIEDYYRRYPRVLAFQQACTQQAKKTGQSLTMLGRIRLIPEITSKNAHLRAAAERLAVNTPLQGSAADLIKLAMLEVDKRIQSQKLKSYLILQVHDELIFECPDEEISEMKELVKQSMESVLDLKVPLVVNVAIGKNWGDC